MGVAAEIGQHLFGPAERAAWHRRPIRCARSSASRAAKAAGSARPARSPKKRSSPASKAACRSLQEQAAEQAREHAHRQEEARPAGDPARAVGREAAARHDAMDMRMMVQGLAPGVQHGDEADLGAEMLGIGGDRAQRLGRGLEQDGVDRSLVLEGDRGDRRRQGEDDVEVGHRQQLGLPRGEPFRRAPAPGTSGNAGCGRSCRRRGSARSRRSRSTWPPSAAVRHSLDRAHDAALDAAEMAVMGLPDTHRRGGGRYPPPPALADIGAPAQPGGTTSRFSRSSGLVVPPIRLVATWV